MFAIPFFVSLAAMVVGLLDMPYGYYALLKLAVFASAVYGFTLVSKANTGLAVAMGAIAVLYNPLIQIQLGSKGAWLIANIITLAIFYAVIKATSHVKKNA